MILRMAALCDAVTVRDNLLNALGAGVTALHVPEYPAQMNIALALLLELSQIEGEVGAPHTLTVKVNREGDGADLGEARMEFAAAATATAPKERGLVVPIGLPLQALSVTAPGGHRVTLGFDGDEIGVLYFDVYTAEGVPS